MLDLLGQSENDIYWIMDRWDYSKANGDSGGYAKYDAFHTAVQTGKDLRKVVKEYTDNGVSKQTLKSQVTAHFKPLWLEMTPREKGKIRGYLVNAFVLLGDSREDAIKKINNWQ